MYIETSYAGYTVRPIHHTEPFFIKGKYVSDGFVVTPENEPLINVMPGATWFQTVDDALTGIDVLLAVDKDGTKFWHLLRAIQRMTGKLD